MPEHTPDFMLDVLEGKRSASLEELHAWRDHVAKALDEWRTFRSIERTNNYLADAYRARMHEAVERGMEHSELVLAKLDALICAQEWAA